MNIEILYFINSFAAEYWPAFFVFMANDFGYLLLLTLVYFLFLHQDKEKGMREITTMLFAAIAACLVAHLIKYILYVPRPFVALPDINLLLPHEDNSAFPSGHATFYSGLAMAMYFYHKRIAAALALGALVIGISRIAVGIHYPADILAGFIIGPIVATLVYYAVGKLLQNRFGQQ